MTNTFTLSKSPHSQMSCSRAFVLIAMVKRMWGNSNWKSKRCPFRTLYRKYGCYYEWMLCNKENITLKTGWTAGSCLYMAIPKTSDIRCVLRRCVTVWCTWKSEDLTQILASNQSYWSSIGRKIGLSSPGVWPSCVIELKVIFKTHIIRNVNYKK